jgi:hypothetical protein
MVDGDSTSTMIIGVVTKCWSARIGPHQTITSGRGA